MRKVGRLVEGFGGRPHELIRALMPKFALL